MNEKYVIDEVKGAIKELDTLKGKFETILGNLEQKEMPAANAITSKMRFRTKASFDLKGNEKIAYLNYKTVLKVLATEAVNGPYRNIIFVNGSEFLDRIEKDESFWENGTWPESLKVLAGKSDTGFRMGVMAAQNDQGKETFFYLVEDTIMRTLLIVGDEVVSKNMINKLAGKNISYIDKNHDTAAQGINQFLRNTISERPFWRVPRGKEKATPLAPLVGTLVSAFAEAVPLSTNVCLTIPRGTTLGHLMAGTRMGAEKPVVYSCAIKKAM